MMKKSAILALSVAAATAFTALARPGCASAEDDAPMPDTPSDSISQAPTEAGDAPLNEADYARAADSLGVDVAAIHAVIDVEAGVRHKGIWADGKPLVAFSARLFRSKAQARRISLKKHMSKYPEVFSAPNKKKYGSYEAAQYARLQQAMEIDSVAAVYGAYWGMFQIAGEHWKLCGCESIHDFVSRMSASEREQLEMFVAFVRNTGMDVHLRNRHWAKFARRYNGPSYARRGYHTKLAKAYRKYAAAAGKP